MRTAGLACEPDRRSVRPAAPYHRCPPTRGTAMLSFHPTAERSAPRLRGLAALRHAVTALAAVAALTVSVGAVAAQPQAAAPRVAFDVARDGASITVRATALVRADRETVWRTLVDYPRLPDFIPDMQFSALVSREGDDALVHQSGRAGIGPFTRGFSLTLAVHEVPLRE